MPQLQRAEQLISNYVAKQHTLKHLNAFISLPSPTTHPSPTASNDGPLTGQHIAIKDNICTRALPTTCASAGLKNFTSPFNATVVTQLLSAGATLAGKTNLDEFGMGSHSLHSSFGAVHTPSGTTAGGSSGGSAVAVATGQCSGALGTDTGGSVRLPAAYNNIVGFKPTYGLISRWGVVAYANSLDTVGFLGPSVASVAHLFHTCNVHDPKDPTSLSPATRARIAHAAVARRKTSPSSLRIGIPNEYITPPTLSPPVRTAWAQTITHLRAKGHTIHAVSLPHTPHALPAYYVLAPAEASSNLAKYDAVRYGGVSHPITPTITTTKNHHPSSSSTDTTKEVDTNLYTTTRATFFGPEVRRRILLGSYTLSSQARNNYFLRAQRIRRLVARDFDAVFARPHPLRPTTNTPEGEDQGDAGRGVDFLLTPTAATPPRSLSEVEAEVAGRPTEEYSTDVFTVPASLAGLPAVSVPVGDGVGMQVLGQVGDDDGVLDLGRELMGEEA